ncbi:hypothetical protein PM082_016686 [Marasmius tenuissimus]|nr:hypothetical protein PM082_016686 [Marasmius tenuissimus]
MSFLLVLTLIWCYRSVHNIRIERLWRDVTLGFGAKWKFFFQELEVHDGLNVNNNTHIWLLQHLFLPSINEDALAWAEAWNRHPLTLRHQRSQSPVELFTFGMMENGLRGMDSIMNIEDDHLVGSLASQEDRDGYGVDWEDMEDPAVLAHHNNSNLMDSEDSTNPFTTHIPDHFSHVEVQSPDCPLTTDQLQLLHSHLDSLPFASNRDMDSRRLLWIEAFEYIHDPDIAGAICGCEHAELEHGQRPPPPPPPSLPPKGGIPGRCEGWYLAGGIPSTKSVCSRPGCGAKWFLHHLPPNSTPSLSGIFSAVPSATPRLVGPWQAPTRSAVTTSALGTATSSVLGSTPWVTTRQINVPRDGRVTNHEILEGINSRHTSTLPAPNRFVAAANQVKESKSSSRKRTDYDPCFRQSDNWVQNFQVILLPATDSTIFPPEHLHAFSQKNRPNFKLCIGQLEEQLESISLFGLSFPLTVQAHSKTANIFPALYSAIYNHCQSKGLTPEKIGFPAIPPSTPSSSPLLMCHLGNKVGGKITVKQSMLITNNDWMLEKLSQTTGGGEIPLSVERRQVVFFSFKRPLMGPLRDGLIHPCHVYHFLNTQSLAFVTVVENEEDDLSRSMFGQNGQRGRSFEVFSVTCDERRGGFGVGWWV